MPPPVVEVIMATRVYGSEIFSQIKVSGQPNVDADSDIDILTLIAGSNITLTTDATNDTVTIATTGLANQTHTGDATGATALIVVGINNTLLSSLTTGILKNTTTTGVPSIAIASDFPTLNQNTTGSSASCTGNSATVTTNANLTGDVTSVGNATTLTNAPVIAKVLTGYVSGAGTVAATDTILQAIQKLNGNNATNANLTGVITSVGNTTSIASQTGTGSKFVMDTSPIFSETIEVESTSAASFGAMITLDHNSASPAAGDVVGRLYCTGRRADGNSYWTSYIDSIWTDPATLVGASRLEFHVRNGDTDNTGITISDNGQVTAMGIISLTIVRLKGYTVATLPAGTQGDTAFVTDALTPTYLVTVVGGGAVVCPVFYNGTAWISG